MISYSNERRLGEPVRIILCGLNFSPELVGIGKYTGELAQYLADHGHSVTVITAPPYYPYWKIQPGYTAWWYQTEIQENLKIIRCPLWVPSKVSGFKRILHLFSFALFSFSVVLWESRHKPDVIFSIAPALPAAPAVALAGRLCGALTWLHIQDFELDIALGLGILKDHAFLRSLAQRFEQLILRRFDRVSAISHSMTDRLVEKGVDLEKINFFPNWVDTATIYPKDDLNSYRSSLGLSANDHVVLYSGSMGVKHGLEVIIAAASILQAKNNIHFVICGEGPARQDLFRAAKGYSRVHFLPLQPVAQLNELLNMADIHILPQKPRAADLVMPSKLLGMLASGRPVITACREGSELFNLVNSIGISVASEDAQALSQAILVLVENPLLRENLGQKSRDFVVENFSRDTVLGQFISVLQSDLRTQ